MNTKNNLRYRENEERIISAMLDLMQCSPAQNITVSKICSIAGVNRTTFYAHFGSIYAMLDEMEKKMGEELMIFFVNKNTDISSAFTYDSFVIFFEFVKEHLYFYRTFFKFRNEFSIGVDTRLFWEVAIKPYYENAGISSEDEMNYYYGFFYSGFVAVVKEWIENGCRESVIDIARIIKNCVPKLN